MSLIFNDNSPLFQLEAESANDNGLLAKLHLSAPKMHAHEYHVGFELYKPLNENELNDLLKDVKEFMLAANAYINKPDSI